MATPSSTGTATRSRPSSAAPCATSPACRTAALGGHVEECDRCGHGRSPTTRAATATAPSARPRAAARVAGGPRGASCCRSTYFHVVFTLPAALGPIALQNPRVVYGLLFRAAAETLLQVAADPKHLGAEIGFLAVLHTWGQNLQHHPHVHCVVAGGGLSPDGSRWVACRAGLLPAGARAQPRLPGQVPGRAPRRLRPGAARASTGQLGRAGRPGRVPTAGSPTVARTEWVVYAKPPFGGPGAGAEVPGPVHPPGGDQQPPAGRPGGRPGHVPLEGLRPRGQARGR